MNRFQNKVLFTNAWRIFQKEKCKNVNSFEVRTFNTLGIPQKSKWFSVKGVILRWIPLSTAVYCSWLYQKGINEDLTNVELKCYTFLPLRIVSKIWGKIASVELPESVRPWVYTKYTNLFDVNLGEAYTDDLNHYKSLNEFFVRRLKDDARVVEGDGCLVSPCDGKILTCGPAANGRVEQVKGVTYSLESFLGENTWSDVNNNNKQNVNISADDYGIVVTSELKTLPQTIKITDVSTTEIREINNKNETSVKSVDVSKDPNNAYYNSLLSNPDNILHQVVIYLAPGDYHRFHSPCQWSADFRRHFSGKLLSVNPLFAKLIPGLFCVNERALYLGRWQHGFFSFTAVGATNVGSITIYRDDKLKTNGIKRRLYDEIRLQPGFDLQRGELLGQFNMGSTVVLIFEAPKDFKFSFQDGDAIKMGQKLGCSGQDKKK